ENVNFGFNDLFEFAEQNVQLNVRDFSVLIKEQTELLQDINSKIQIGLNRSDLSNTEVGVFKDLQNSYIKLETNLKTLVDYFKNPPTKEEKALINKIVLIKANIEHISNLKKALDETNIDNNVRQFTQSVTNLVRLLEKGMSISLSKELKIHQGEFKNFCSHIEQKMSNSAKNYEVILDSFLQRENKKLSSFSAVFTKFAKSSKALIISVVLFFAFFGVVFGSLTTITYFKYKELNNLSELINRVNGIEINKNNKDLILNIPKRNSSFTENKDKYKITLIGGN
ncbi:hypothetical protein AWR29_09285, partial [Campylobacter fetus subsp. venerealis]